MAPAVNRTLSISWGAFTVGGNTDRELDGQVDMHVGWETSNVSFTVMVQADQGAADPDVDFATKCVAIETAFRTPRLNLVVSQGAATLVSFSHTASTGFTGVPMISKSEDEANTGYSRRYHISIDIQMPADVTLTNGRREADIRVIFSPSRRRRCEISGVYTSLPPAGGAARAQYQASIDAYALTVLTALGGTWELAEEPTVTEDDVQKVVHFARVYDELIFKQAGAALDSTSIVRQTLRISRARTSPGDSIPGGGGGPDAPRRHGGIGGGGFNAGGVGGQFVGNAPGSDFGGIGGTPGGPGGFGSSSSGTVNRLVEVDASYECWVDHTVTTNLESLYSTIKTFIVEQIKSVLSLGVFALTDDRPTFDFDDNRISASVRGSGATTSGLVQYTMSVEETHDPGLVLVPIWSGDSMAKYVYQGPSTRTQSINEQALVFGGGAFALNSVHEAIGEDDNWVLRPHTTSHRSVRMGLDGNTLDLTEVSRVTVREYFSNAR
jgi:hypothetical protein